MNQKQRTLLAELVSQISTITEKLDEMATEEQDKYANLSEGFQSSEKGQTLENNAGQLSTAVDELYSVIFTLEEIE